MKNLNVYLKKTGLLMLFIGIVSCGSTKTGDMTDLKADATEAKAAMTAAEPNLAELFTTSAGYAIFPNVGKGAYIIGGASGNGIVYENGTMVGYANLKQVDVGLQVGGKAYREVIFFENEEDLNKFKAGDYELSGNATAVILEKGKSKTIKFTDGTAVATMPKAGAMVGVSVAGQRFGYTEM
ncbi:lipid-binding SYLF domain-containing protein [Christiangramia sp. OXR-203]|jgi:lipid-binding SYLF domain-containing protein|uniref:lipid-binding SYLF domain-containing protein n=1 Tax=unclassified Christiangramia TaxID=2615027 RepID=UPI002AC8A3C0|nr:lipid-binding SYLF domain-containing protein [Christiangramia sp. OXR-203]WPY99008.1 lipid-binding SYLF domain-containing protein [Christiangramia sp. OXR-203]